MNKKKILTGIAVAAFWLGIWQLISMAIAQELLVPAPFAVLRVIAENGVTLQFWQTVGISMLRIVFGFLLAVAIGIVLAVLTVRFAWLRNVFAPVLHCVKAAPVASFIILALVWIPTDILPTFICFLMVVPIVWSNVEQGIRKTDQKLLEMTKVYRVGRWRTLIGVQIPSVLPYLMSALTTGLGFAWKSGIAAEVICQPKFAIGRQLHIGRMYLETPQVFAWTAVVILMSVLLERLLKAVVRLVSKRYGFSDIAGEGTS